MKLIAGLGNPGPRYTDTRHNIGFIVVEELMRRVGGGESREKFKGVFSKVWIGQEGVILLRPMTFMNRSGESIRPAMDFFGISAADVVVIHDELDLPFGRVKVKEGGGHGGHNGLRSVNAHLGESYVRVRCGIGRPPHGNVTNFVLGSFPAEEGAWVQDLIDSAADAVESIVRDGVTTAMNRFNVDPARK